MSKTTARSHLVVGYTDTSGGADALALALALADRGADPPQIVVASAYPYDPRAPAARATTQEYRVALAEDAERRLDEARRICGDRPGVSFVVRAGTSPAQALQGLAQELEADAIVVGRSHTGPLGRAFVGSVTEQTIHGAPCAVAVAPVGYAATPHRIATVGVASDGSDEAVRALAVAVDVARRRDASLRIVRVLKPMLVTDGGFVDAYPLSARREDAQVALDAASGPLSDVRVETRILIGDPVQALCAPDQAVDLLVAGSRSFGPVRRILLGSVSARLCRQCPSPLLIVPRGAAEEGSDPPTAAGSPGATTTGGGAS